MCKACEASTRALDECSSVAAPAPYALFRCIFALSNAPNSLKIPHESRYMTQVEKKDLALDHKKVLRTEQ